MSNFNVQRDSWLEVAFEDRNKAYGAYRIRKESDTTTLKALFFGIGLGAICLGLFSFTTDEAKPKKPDAPKLPETEVIHVIKPKQDEPKPEPTKGTDKPLKNDVPNINIPPKVVDQTEVKPIEEPKNPTPNTPYNPNGDPNGNPEPAGTPNGTVNTPTTTPSEPGDSGSGLYKGVLGVEAKFPGGIDKFRDFVATKYQVPSSFNKDFLTIELIFTIAKDGSMTDIRMTNNADKALEKEAIRVLKAMNKKWSPGMVNGKAVNSERRFSIKLDLREIEE